MFLFFKMAATAILHFKFLKFYWLTMPGVPRGIAMPNFVKIGQSFAEIPQFFNF